MTNKPYHIYSDTIEQGALDQFFTALASPYVVQGALLPDAHQGYTLPIGAVVAVREHTETFTQQMVGITTNHTNDTVDEAPDAYKSIFEVIALQSELIDVIDHIKPIINIKG